MRRALANLSLLCAIGFGVLSHPVPLRDALAAVLLAAYIDPTSRAP